MSACTCSGLRHGVTTTRPKVSFWYGQSVQVYNVQCTYMYMYVPYVHGLACMYFDSSSSYMYMYLCFTCCFSQHCGFDLGGRETAHLLVLACRLHWQPRFRWAYMYMYMWTVVRSKHACQRMYMYRPYTVHVHVHVVLLIRENVNTLWLMVLLSIQTELCVARGPGNDMFDSTRIIGEKQYNAGKVISAYVHVQCKN